MKIDSPVAARVNLASPNRSQAANVLAVRRVEEESGVRASVSADAHVASALFEQANEYVRAQHLEPFDGYQRGTVGPNAYVNVERYNAYVIEEAAERVSIEAAKSGVLMDKAEIINALRVCNSAITNMKDDYFSRVEKLGSSSLLMELTQADLDGLTDMYIAARERGANVGQVELVAVEIGSARRDLRLGITTEVYDPEKEITGYGRRDQSNISENNKEDVFAKTKAEIFDKSGIPDRVIDLLVNASRAGNAQSEQILLFLESLI